MKYLYIYGAMLLFIFNCGDLDDPDADYEYTPPQSAQTEFSISSLAAEGIDESLITSMTDLIVHEKYKRIDGLLILRNNRLVYENYFYGHTADIKHNIFSAGKSITSILAGIAIDKGFISGTNASVVEMLPEYESFDNPNAKKSNITVEHLLNMNSGLDCDDSNKHTEQQMQKSNDWVKFTMDLPLVHDPGSAANYCTGCPVTLGRVIENQSGLSLEEFANKNLFGPLGITTYQWHIMPDGSPSGGGLLFLRPRDMAKIGLLMINNGMYNDVQIVSEEWVERSRQKDVKVGVQFDGYGYLWWKQAFSNGVESYFADGNGGQQIFVIPSRQLVVVFTAGNKNTGLGLQNFEIVNKYILPATL